MFHSQVMSYLHSYVTNTLHSYSLINTKAGLNYETPECKSMFGSDFKYVDENAVRLDLDDLGGQIVRCFISLFFL